MIVVGALRALGIGGPDAWPPRPSMVLDALCCGRCGDGYGRRGRLRPLQRARSARASRSPRGAVCPLPPAAAASHDRSVWCSWYDLRTGDWDAPSSPTADPQGGQRAVANTAVTASGLRRSRWWSGVRQRPAPSGVLPRTCRRAGPRHVGSSDGRPLGPRTAACPQRGHEAGAASLFDSSRRDRPACGVCRRKHSRQNWNGHRRVDPQGFNSDAPAPPERGTSWACGCAGGRGESCGGQSSASSSRRGDDRGNECARDVCVTTAGGRARRRCKGSPIESGGGSTRRRSTRRSWPATSTSDCRRTCSCANRRAGTSNFLLWQSAYAEWSSGHARPDVDRRHLWSAWSIPSRDRARRRGAEREQTDPSQR